MAEDPTGTSALGRVAWKALPFFLFLGIASYFVVLRSIKDPRPELAVKSALEDWFVVEALTGKSM